MPRVRQCKHLDCHTLTLMPNYYCSKHQDEEAEYKAKREQYHHNKQSAHFYNQVTRYRDPIKVKQNKFYHTKQWTELRQVAFQRDYHLCQYCQSNSGNIVDHVLPIEAFPDGMSDIDNLVTCCRDCHAKKTRWEEKYYGTGQRHNKTGNEPITEISVITNLMNGV